MGEIYLTVSEVADLKGCTERNIRLSIERGRLHAETAIVKGRGNASTEYRIPLTALSQNLQLKYKRRQKEERAAAMKAVKAIKAAYVTDNTDSGNISHDDTPEEPQPINFEVITAAEREQIAFWKSILAERDKFRAKSSLPKTEADEAFVTLTNERLAITHPHITLTVGSLYRKRKALYELGENALIDRRGKHSSHSKKLTDAIFDIFEYYYLDNSQKTASLCMFLTQEEIGRLHAAGEWTGELPELPSLRTFERAAQNIPIPYIKFFREGEKAFISDCAPYIKRIYEDLEPNDIWVGDGHTFDIMVLGKDGKPFRPYLSAFMDVRTRKMMGWIVVDKLSGDASIYALKRGVENYGAPKALQVDNGREYLFHDFGGDGGFRKKAKRPEGEFRPPTILETLGIEFRTSLPRNARAKAVERAFGTIKETFSKLFDGYTGGSVAEKPDKLKKVMQKPEETLMGIDEFINAVDTYIRGFYNKQPHHGEGMWGMSPDEAFAKLLEDMRVVPKDRLYLMFMRYSKGTIKVGKNGVNLKVYGERLTFSNPYLWENYFGRDVYVRYSPDDLSTVRVYDTDNKFICEAALDGKVSYNADKDTIQERVREKNAMVRNVRNYKKAKDIQAQDELTAILTHAAANVQIKEDISPRVVRFAGLSEDVGRRDTLPKAVGAETALPKILDW